MNIYKLPNTHTSFTSRNCPIKPFMVESKSGDLFVEELTSEESAQAARFQIQFYEREFPHFSKWIKPKDAVEREEVFEALEYLQQIMLNKPEGNSTVLVGRDSQQKIKAMFALGDFDEFAWAKEKLVDKQTAYVSNCLVEADYRGQGVGEKMLEKLLKTADGKFTDIFLEANYKAVDFYKRAGFKPLDLKIPELREISAYIMANRSDSESLTLMSKSLDPTNHWWKRIVKYLK